MQLGHCRKSMVKLIPVSFVMHKEIMGRINPNDKYLLVNLAKNSTALRIWNITKSPISM
ncbi:hypothetical protein X975_09257, partial [Stegodyphus mimosarum]